MPHISHNPPELFNSTQYGFSQVTVAQGSQMVFISGQVGWDANETPAQGLEAQIEQAFTNLRIAIEAAGGTLADIAALRIYFREEVRDELGPLSTALIATFPANPPTASWIGVQTLSRENILIEIEATAIIH